MRTSKPLEGLLLLALILLCSCGLLRKGGGDRTTVAVTPAGDGKPHSISAVVVVAPLEPFREGVKKAGTGLRTAGERMGIRVHYGVLDSAAEEVLLQTLQVGEAAWSPPVGLATGDEVEIRGGTALPATGGHCAAHVITRGSGDRIENLDVGFVARPADGSLLPVIRAGIPLTGSGTYLISFDSGTGETFGLFLRLDLAGRSRAAGTASFHRHRLSVRSFTIKTVDLSRILRLENIEERGGPGGIVLETKGQDETGPLVRALAEDGTVGPETNRLLTDTASTTMRAGGLNLLVRSGYDSATATYGTEISVQNRGALPPLSSTHGERDLLLLFGWDAESPGLSTVALVSLSPVE